MQKKILESQETFLAVLKTSIEIHEALGNVIK